MSADFEFAKDESGHMTALSASVLGGHDAYLPQERKTLSGKNRPTAKGDMYSVGVVLLLSFVPIHIPEVEKLRKNPMDVIEELKPAAGRLDPVVLDVIEALLSHKPEQRPSARQILDGFSPSTGEQNLDSYFCRVADDVPAHWTASSGRHLVSEVTPREFERIRCAVQSTMPHELGVGFDQGQEWAKLGFQLTCDESGKRKLTHKISGKPMIDIKKAWRVENRDLWRRYNGGVVKIVNDISRGPPLDSEKRPKIDSDEIATYEDPQVLNYPPTMQHPSGFNNNGRHRNMGPRGPVDDACSKGGGGFTDHHTDAARRNVNEAFLLHGLPADTLHKVLTNGLSEKFSGQVGSLFGEGIYFAECIEKADQYAKEAEKYYVERDPLHAQLYPGGADDHPGDVCYALLCRVAMGYTIRTDRRARRRPGDNQCIALDGLAASETGMVFATNGARELVALPPSQRSEGQIRPIYHHSLVVELGGDVVRFREFVTMHGEYTYPEYVIAYKRIVTDSSRPPDGIDVDQPEPQEGVPPELEPEPEA